MAVVENNVYEEYLNNLTKRLVMPTMVMIWSMEHPLFPQVSWVVSFLIWGCEFRLLRCV